jgi:hypothetical protein
VGQGDVGDGGVEDFHEGGKGNGHGDQPGIDGHGDVKPGIDGKTGRREFGRGHLKRMSVFQFQENLRQKAKGLADRRGFQQTAASDALRDRDAMLQIALKPTAWLCGCGI